MITDYRGGGWILVGKKLGRKLGIGERVRLADARWGTIVGRLEDWYVGMYEVLLDSGHTIPVNTDALTPLVFP